MSEFDPRTSPTIDQDSEDVFEAHEASTAEGVFDEDDDIVDALVEGEDYIDPEQTRRNEELAQGLDEIERVVASLRGQLRK